MGDVVGVGVADGGRDEGGELDGGRPEVPWAGRPGSAAGPGWPVNSRARAATTTPRTATAPPVATPAANERRSRRYSVVRRSRSQAGSAARRAAQLLTGAAARPSVGNSSRPASSGPLSWFVLVRAAPMADEAEQRQGGFGPVGAQRLPPAGLLAGLRRAQERGLLGEQAEHRRARTTSEVDCQMKNAPIASRQDAPVPRRSSAIARTRPSRTITGTAETRNTVSLRNSWPPPVARLAAPASRKMKNSRLSRSPYHCSAPDQVGPALAGGQVVGPGWRGLGSSERQCTRRIWMPPKHHRYRCPLSASKVSGMMPRPEHLVHVQPVPARPEQPQRQLGVLGDAPTRPSRRVRRGPPAGSAPWCRRRWPRRARCGTAARRRRNTCRSSRAAGSTGHACQSAVVLRRLDEADPRVGERGRAAAQQPGLDLVVRVDDADDVGLGDGELAQRVVQRPGLVARPVVQVRELDPVPRAPGLHRAPQRLVVGVVVDEDDLVARIVRAASASAACR